MTRRRSVQTGQPIKSRRGRIGAPPLFGKCCISTCSGVRPGLEIAVDVLDQDDRGIDDDAEIDGADREQVGVLAADDQNDDAEEQRERDIGADDDGAAQVAEEQPLNEEDQQAAEYQIVQHRCGGDVDEVLRS